MNSYMTSNSLYAYLTELGLAFQKNADWEELNGWLTYVFETTLHRRFDIHIASNLAIIYVITWKW